MSAVEARFVRDLAAVTGGVVVTEADLREARSRVHERIERRRRRGHLRTIAVAAAVVAGLTVAVPAVVQLTDGESGGQVAIPAPDPASAYLTGAEPTMELLRGIWRLDNGGVSVKFDEDGTVRFDERGTLFSDPTTTGTYLLDGELITISITEDEDPSCVGTQFSLRASFPQAGTMRFVRPPTSGSCAPLPAVYSVLEQVLPASPGMSDLMFSTDSHWTPLSDDGVLHGVWIAEGGGHVLEMDPGGSYFVADDTGEPIDRGQWSVTDEVLSLASSTLSARCDPGDRLVLAAVMTAGGGTTAFRGALERNDCQGAWTPAAWILIPHVGS